MGAFRLKLSVKEEKGRVILQECTGKYSFDNPGGYGLPNIKLSNVTGATVEVYKPNAAAPVLYNLFPDYPTDDTRLQYEILVSALGMTFVESGKWRFVYTITGTDDKGLSFEYSCTAQEVFLDNARCCVDKMIGRTANIPANALMKDERKKSTAELSILMDLTETLVSCGDFNAAQENLSYINLQCQNCCG